MYGGTEKFQSDPYWHDHLLFYEYFHGDNGAGLGASHQTGWTGLVAKLIQLHGLLNPQRFLAGGKLLHEGQLEGRKVWLPVFLERRPPGAGGRSVKGYQVKKEIFKWQFIVVLHFGYNGA